MHLVDLNKILIAVIFVVAKRVPNIKLLQNDIKKTGPYKSLLLHMLRKTY